MKEKKKAKTKKYRAKVGMNFDALDKRVEKGELIPKEVTKEEIKDLLDLDWIEEAD